MLLSCFMRCIGDMKKSYLTLFLVMLYIAPLVFTMSCGSLVIPTEPNITKDFQLAHYEPWLKGWDKRRTINITGSAGAGTKYQVYITVDNGAMPMQDDYGDIRFTDNDGMTLLDYWLEDFGLNYNPAYFWVNVTDNLDTDQWIYMYWDTDEDSTTTSNGADTFLFYEDWTSETVDAGRWDQQTSDGSISYASGGAEHGNIATISGDPGVDVWHIESDLHLASPFAVRFRSNLESTVASSQRVIQGIGTAWGAVEPRSLISSDAGSELFMVCDDDGNADDQSMVNTYHDTYTIWDITRDDDTATLIADGAPIETGDMAPDTDTTNVFLIYVRDSEYQVLSDWMFVRKFVAVEPEFDSWGEVEDAAPQEWHELGTPILIFSILIDETGLNLLLIFLGLAMVPLSVLYLVKGGKSEASMDKLFFGLIAFVIGWALFLGGIM